MKDRPKNTDPSATGRPVPTTRLRSRNKHIQRESPQQTAEQAAQNQEHRDSGAETHQRRSGAVTTNRGTIPDDEEIHHMPTKRKVRNTITTTRQGERWQSCTGPVRPTAVNRMNHDDHEPQQRRHGTVGATGAPQRTNGRDSVQETWKQHENYSDVKER